jgi:hypothetical protein
LEIDEDVVDADLRGGVRDVDLGSDGAARLIGDEWNVLLERRIGVVRDEDYEGTIVAACRTSVADGPA